MGSRELRRDSQRRKLFFAVMAFFVYGAWAHHANASHGSSASLRAAVTQGAASFTTTLLFTTLLEGVFRLGRTPRQGFWLASTVTSATSASLLAGGHWIAGTPRILATIAPSVTVGMLFYASYAFGLFKVASRVGEASAEPRGTT